MDSQGLAVAMALLMLVMTISCMALSSICVRSARSRKCSLRSFATVAVATVAGYYGLLAGYGCYWVLTVV